MGGSRGAYRQKFRESWLQEKQFKGWLQRVAGNQYAAKCKYCGLLGTKHSDLVAHGNGVAHKRKAEPFSDVRQQFRVDEFLPAAPQAAPLQLESLVALCGLALFITCHTAVRVIDHLTDLCKRVFRLRGSEDIQDLKMHRTKCCGVIKNILYPHFQNSLREDIGDGYFSLLVDESTDISVTKKMGIVIEYFSKSARKFVYTHLAIVVIEAADAEAIAQEIKRVLVANGLNILKLRGIGTDNASVMTGINNGVYKILKKEVPHLILIRCVCHSIQLAVSDAAKAFLPKHLEFMISETYNWFARSHPRSASYERLFKTMNAGKNPRKLVKLCKTRWLVIEEAIRVILEQYDELKLYFSIAETKADSYTAKLLYQMYSHDINHLYLQFIHPILQETQKCNKKFQSNSADPLQLLNDLTLLISGLVTRVIVPGFRGNLLTVNVTDHLSPKPKLGYSIEESLSKLRSSGKISEEQYNAFQNSCRNFMARLCTELQSRLPSNLEILQKIGMFSPKRCLTPFKNPIAPLAEAMGFSPPTIRLIELQWDKIHLQTWKNITDTRDFWIEVFSFRDSTDENPFAELVDLAMVFLVLPWSNADVERLFSQHNIVKNKLRNRMGNELANAILAIRAGLKRMGFCCKDYAVPVDTLHKINTMAAYKTTPVQDDEQEDFVLDIEWEGDDDVDVPAVQFDWWLVDSLLESFFFPGSTLV